MYNPNTKNEAKRLRATTFVITKLEEQYGEQWRKVQIVLQFEYTYIIIFFFFFLDLNVLDECEGPRNMGKLEESYVLLKKSDSSNQDMVRIDR